MRLLATLVLVSAVCLGGCAKLTAGLATVAPISIAAAAAAPDITNDIGLACRSAEGLLSLADGHTGKIATFAQKLNVQVTKYCDMAPGAIANATTALNAVNYAAAVLLGTGVAQ